MIDKIKYCPFCDTEKDISLFVKNSSSKDGSREYCKDCYIKGLKHSPETLRRLAVYNLQKLKKDYEIYLKQQDKLYSSQPEDTIRNFKFCSDCKVFKPLDLFSKTKSTVDGYRRSCKDCRNFYQKFVRIYKKYPDLDVLSKEHKSRIRENKRKLSNKMKYGVEYPIQNTQIKKRIENTMMERYDVKNYTKAEDYLDKRSKTCLKRYGVDNYFKHKNFQEKRIKSNLEKYGKPYPIMKEDWILSSGEPIVDYANRFSKNITTCRRIYASHGIEALKNWVEKDERPPRTTLELYFQELSGLSFFGSRLDFNGQHRYPDFKLNDTTYIDVDGLYWHCEPNLSDKKHHFIKRLDYENAGLFLLQLREDEIKFKPDIIRNIINIYKGTTSSIYARKCSIKRLEWRKARSFFEQTHIQGSGTTAKSLALVYNNELVQILSYRWKKKKEILEIARFSTRLNTRVVGGFSKLLKEIIRIENPPTIHSFCDLRYSQGKVYECNGFVKVKEEIGWCWTDYNNTFNRLKCKAGQGLSERRQAEKMGWVKLYDAGQRLYKLEI